MTETYCGKSCMDCAHRENLGCSGCKTGPGAQLDGDCELAKCARTKGHETCDTCSFRGTCHTRFGKDRMPESRIRKREYEIVQRTAVMERSVVLGKWLRILFLVIIFGDIANFFTNETVAAWAPGMLLPGKLLSAGVTIVCGLIYLKLKNQNERYRTVGIITLVCVPLNFLNKSAIASGPDAAAGLLLAIALGGLALFSTYQEYTAHSEVLTGADNDLAEKWCKLWTWEILLLGMMVAGMVVLFIIPLLGALASLGSTIALLVLSIVRIVYLYRTAQVFRNISGAV